MDARRQANYVSPVIADTTFTLEQMEHLRFAARVVEARLKEDDAGNWLAAHSHLYQTPLFRSDGARYLSLARSELSEVVERLSSCRIRLGTCENYSRESLEVLRKAFGKEYIVVEVDDYGRAAYYATDVTPYCLPLWAYASITVCTSSREHAYEQSKHLESTGVAPLGTVPGGDFDEGDIIYALRQSGAKTYHLGSDELPQGVQDIRGSIRDENGAIYASIDIDNRATYFALVDAFVICPECGAIVDDDAGATSPCHKTATLVARPAW